MKQVITKGRSHAVVFSGLCGVRVTETELLSAACRSQERSDYTAGEGTAGDRFRGRGTSGSVTSRP